MRPKRHHASGALKTYNFIFDDESNVDSRVSVTRSAGQWSRVNSSGQLVFGTSANTARITHTFAGVVRGLLIEPERTNLWLQSADILNAVNDVGSEIQSTSTGGHSDPAGGANASLLDFTANTNGTYVQQLFSGLSEGQSYTTSTHIQVGANNAGSLETSFFDWGNNTDYVDGLTSQWRRTEHTNTYSGGATGRIQYDNLVNARVVTYLYGSQLEAGSFATSYIPTTTSSVTRPAETGVFSSLENASGYTIIAVGEKGTYTLTNQTISGGTYNFQWSNFSGATTETVLKQLYIGPAPEPEPEPEPDEDPAAVSPAWHVNFSTGSDQFTGTASQVSGTTGPFRTLQKALDAVAGSNVKYIYVAGTQECWDASGGTMRQWTIDSSHDGLRLMREPDQTWIIEGGEKVNSMTDNGDGRYYKTLATHNGVMASVNGEYRRCSTPKAEDPNDHLGHFMFAVGGNHSQIQYRDSDSSLIEGFEQDGLFVDSVDPPNWQNSVIKVNNINQGANLIIPNFPTRKNNTSGSPFTLYNHASWVRQAGEFGWLASNSRIYYWPKAGEDPTSVNFDLRVARYGIAFDINGASDVIISGFWARNFEFDHLTQLPTDVSASLHRGSLPFRIRGQSSFVRFAKFKVSNCGTGMYYEYSDDGTVAGGAFNDMGQNGVLTYRVNYASTSDRTYCNRINVIGNTFRDIGRVKRHGACLHAYGTRNYSTNAGDGYPWDGTIGHTYEYNSSLRTRRWMVGLPDFEGYGGYSGQFKSPSVGCKIRYNRMFFGCYGTADSGAILYQQGRSYNDNTGGNPQIQHHTEVAYNYGYHSGGRKSDPGRTSFNPTGNYNQGMHTSFIYPDDFTSGGDFHHNVFVGFGWGGMHPHGGDNGRIYNNAIMGFGSISYRHIRHEDHPESSGGHTRDAEYYNNVFSRDSNPSNLGWLSNFSADTPTFYNNQTWNVNTGTTGAGVNSNPNLDSNYIPTTVISGIDPFFAIEDVGAGAFDKSKLRDSVLQSEWDTLTGYIVEEIPLTEALDSTGCGYTGHYWLQ